MASLQIRRGTDAERQRTVFLLGEPVWTTDTKQLYIGDGGTAGGQPVVVQTSIGADLTITNSVTVGTGTTHIQAFDNYISLVRNGSEKVRLGAGNGITQLDSGDGNEFYGNITCHASISALNLGAGTLGVDYGITAGSISATTGTFTSTETTGVVNSGISLTDITGGGQVQLDIWDGGNNTSAKYFIQIKDDSNNVHIQEIVMFYDGTNVSYNEYGIVTSSGTLGTFTADVEASYVRLLFTPDNSAATIKIRIAKTLMAV
jgi:hypothetical protein